VINLAYISFLRLRTGRITVNFGVLFGAWLISKAKLFSVSQERAELKQKVQVQVFINL